MTDQLPGTEYIEAIFVFSIFALALLALPETYAPVILKRKAERLRKQTEEKRYWHPHEQERINLNNVFTKHISRPLRYVQPCPGGESLYN